MSYDPRFDPSAQADLECPECRRPAQITERFTLAGVPAPVEHVKLICASGHWFTLTLDTMAALRRAQPEPARSRVPARDRHPEIARTLSGGR